MSGWLGLSKALEMGDHVIAHTPGAKQPIYANRGADHPAYSSFSPADHIAAANVHANRAKELHISAARQGGSMTLKRQAAQSMHIATTHRQAGVGKPQKLAASMAARKSQMINAQHIYGEVLSKAGGAGSRGGSVVGTTRSGKPIYAHKDATHESYKGFNQSDHEHAADAHLKAASQHIKIAQVKRGSKDAGDAARGKALERAKMHFSAAQGHEARAKHFD